MVHTSLIYDLITRSDGVEYELSDYETSIIDAVFGTIDLIKEKRHSIDGGSLLNYIVGISVLPGYMVVYDKYLGIVKLGSDSDKAIFLYPDESKVIVFGSIPENDIRIAIENMKNAYYTFAVFMYNKMSQLDNVVPWWITHTIEVFDTIPDPPRIDPQLFMELEDAFDAVRTRVFEVDREKALGLIKGGKVFYDRSLSIDIDGRPMYVSIYLGNTYISIMVEDPRVSNSNKVIITSHLVIDGPRNRVLLRETIKDIAYPDLYIDVDLAKNLTREWMDVALKAIDTIIENYAGEIPSKELELIKIWRDLLVNAKPATGSP